jgi:hypothetical protein
VPVEYRRETSDDHVSNSGAVQGVEEWLEERHAYTILVGGAREGRSGKADIAWDQTLIGRLNLVGPRCFMV